MLQIHITLSLVQDLTNREPREGMLTEIDQWTMAHWLSSPACSACTLHVTNT